MSVVKTNKTSDAQLKANKKYDNNYMKHYSVNMPLSVYNIMEKAFGVNLPIKNRNAYTIQAIKEKLTRDGFLLENDD